MNLGGLTCLLEEGNHRHERNKRENVIGHLTNIDGVVEKKKKLYRVGPRL